MRRPIDGEDDGSRDIDRVQRNYAPIEILLFLPLIGRLDVLLLFPIFPYSMVPENASLVTDFDLFLVQPRIRYALANAMDGERIINHNMSRVVFRIGLLATMYNSILKQRIFFIKERLGQRTGVLEGTLMAEFWPYPPDLSIEFDEFDEKGRRRQGRDAAPRHKEFRRSPRSGPQARSLINDRSHLQRILQIIPEPHQEPQASRSSLPALQNRHVARTYAPRVTQIDMVPLAREWGPRVIPARKTNEWRNYAAASIFGAALGINVCIVLFGSEWAKSKSVQALTSAGEIGKTAEPRSLASGSALSETASNQLYDEDAPRPRAADATIAQAGSSQSAFGPAQTYNPNLFAPHDAQESKPDPGLAHKSGEKEKAVKLGGSEAAQRKKLSKITPS